MAWYSILPEHLTVYETWIVRTFVCGLFHSYSYLGFLILTFPSQLFLAVLNMSPWILAILYDFLLWVTRSIWHEVPVYGGRAKGEIRPRAPSLRDSARRQSFVNIIARSHSRSQSHDEAVSDLRKRAHQRTHSSISVVEESEND